MASDEELMLAVKAGNVGAFEEIVLRYQKALVNYFYRLLWNKDTAEDLAQDVFFRLFERAGDYEHKAKFSTFMYRVAHNQYVDFLRKRHSHPTGVSLSGAEDESSPLTERLADNGRDPLQYLTANELEGALGKALQRVGEIYREVFVLCVFHEMKYSEVSAALDVPEGTVKSRMFTAAQKLRELLAEFEENNKSKTDRN